MASAPAWAPANEGRDSIAVHCGDEISLVHGTLADIQVPVLQTAVAGGYGDLVLASVVGVSTGESELFFWQHEDDDARLADLGHTDLLFSEDAEDQVCPELIAGTEKNEGTLATIWWRILA